MIETLKTLKTSIALWLLVAAATVVPGCGDGRMQPVPVSGVVNIDGQPLSLGFVTLVPSQGRSATGDIDGSGRFTLTTYEQRDGALPGTHKVEVIAREALSETKARWHAPKKYASQVTSDITVEVSGPTDDLKIDLSWGGGKPFIETDG